MSNTKVENMIDSLIEMTADPEMPVECIEAIDLAIQSLVDNTDVNIGYYDDFNLNLESLENEEHEDMAYMDILFQNLISKTIGLA